MAQYKKDEIKDKIDSAALTLFSQQGYNETKVSHIAEKAGISVGNIYRYYKSKDEIFYSVVPESFLISFKNLLVNKVFMFKERELKTPQQWNEFWMFNNEIVNFMVENRELILILFHNGKGTKYENGKAKLVDFLIKTIKDTYDVEYNQSLKERGNEITLYIIYENLINMVLRILQESKTLEEVKNHLESINSYHMFGITGLLK